MAAAEKLFSDSMNFQVPDRIEAPSRICAVSRSPAPFLGISAAAYAQQHLVNFMVKDTDNIGQSDARMKQQDAPIADAPALTCRRDCCSFIWSARMVSPGSIASVESVPGIAATRLSAIACDSWAHG